MRLPGAILTLLASIAAATNSTCVPVCTNECVGGPANYTKDGWCDDGGPGWSTDRCSLGTDCDDCGDSCREKPLPSPTADGGGGGEMGFTDVRVGTPRGGPSKGEEIRRKADKDLRV